MLGLLERAPDLVVKLDLFRAVHAVVLRVKEPLGTVVGVLAILLMHL